MNIPLFILKLYIPEYLKIRVLNRLFNITASTFQCQVPEIKGDYNEHLGQFALFTVNQVGKFITDKESLEQIQRSLYRGSYKLGCKIRDKTGIKKPAEILLMSKLMYKILKIEFTGDLEGEVKISRCYFSDYYTPEICKVISSLDRGMATGISGGGNLNFHQRITEGYNCCRAHFQFEEEL